MRVIIAIYFNDFFLFEFILSCKLLIKFVNFIHSQLLILSKVCEFVPLVQMLERKKYEAVPLTFCRNNFLSEIHK